MKPSFFILFLFLYLFTYSQTKVGIGTFNPENTLHVKGILKIGEENNTNVDPGNIRFLDGRFEGFANGAWIPFGREETEAYWPEHGNRGAVGGYYALSTHDGMQGEEYGYAVDMYNDWAIVSQPGWNGNTGRVFCYWREPRFGFWTPQDTIEGSQAGERFGHDVAIYDKTIIVGAPKYKVPNPPFDIEVGAVYLFERQNFKFNQTLHQINGACYTNLGHSVDIYNGDWVAGAIDESFPTCSNPFNNGAVFYYDAYNSIYNWITPRAPSSTGMNRFGYSVSLHSGSLAIGAPFSDGTINEDSVFIYQKPLGSSSYSFNYVLNVITPGSSFGFKVALSQNTLVVGAPTANWSGVPSGGAAVYTRTTSAIIPDFDVRGVNAGDRYGHAISCNNEYNILSPNIMQSPDYSTFYFYTYSTTTNRHQFLLNMTDPIANSIDNYVNDVAQSNKYFVVGLPYGVDYNGLPSGRVFFGKIR